MFRVENVNVVAATMHCDASRESQLKELKTQFEKVVDDLKTRVAANDIARLKLSTIDDLKASNLNEIKENLLKVEAFNARADSLATDISKLTSVAESNKQTLEDMQSHAKSAEDCHGKLREHIEICSKDIKKIESAMWSLLTVSPSTPKTSSLMDVIRGMSAGGVISRLSTLPTAHNLENTVYSMTTNNPLADVKSNISRVESNLTDVKSNISRVESNLSKVESNFSGNLGKVESNLAGNLGKVETKVGEVESNLTGNLAKVETKVGEVESNLTGNLAKVETKVGKVETKVGEVETKVGEVETKVGKVESNLTGNLAKVETKVGKVESNLGKLTEVVEKSVADIDVKIKTKIDAIESKLHLAIASPGESVDVKISNLTKLLSNLDAETTDKFLKLKQTEKTVDDLLKQTNVLSTNYSKKQTEMSRFSVAAKGESYQNKTAFFLPGLSFSMGAFLHAGAVCSTTTSSTPHKKQSFTIVTTTDKKETVLFTFDKMSNEDYKLFTVGLVPLSVLKHSKIVVKCDTKLDNSNLTLTFNH